jgi:hypothetical protein
MTYKCSVQRIAYGLQHAAYSCSIHPVTIQHTAYMYSIQHTAYRIHRTLTRNVSQFMILTVYESGHGPSHKSINMSLAVCETNLADVVHHISP